MVEIIDKFKKGVEGMLNVVVEIKRLGKPGGSYVDEEDPSVVHYTGQEAEDRMVKLEPFCDESAFSVNEDGSFNYPKRRKKFVRLDSYEMMDSMLGKVGKYKRR